ncbi:MAG: T9SS type A sorting domain-containing protein [Bacteroidia bacterium]
MKKILLLIFISLSCFLKAQPPVIFTFSNDLKFISQNGNDTLLNAFTGGFDSPQFNPMDLDGDGIKDLVVFERVGNRLMTFLKKPNGYIYEPKFENEFPYLTNWLIIKDYNCDGIDDIFTEVNLNVQPDKSKFIFNNGVRVIKGKGKIGGKFAWEQTQNQIFDTGVFGMPPTNIAFGNTDLPGIVDIDNDGDLDLLFFPLGRNIISYYQNMSKELGFGCDSLIYVFRDEAFGYMFYKVNEHGFQLHDNTNWMRNYPLQKHSKHNGATFNFVDLDNDGDKDLLYGDVGFNEIIYLENGKTINSLGRDSFIRQDLNFPPASSQKAEVLIFPATFIFNADNDTLLDLIVCPNADDGTSKNNNQILYFKNTGTNSNPVFTFQTNRFMLNNTVDLGGGFYPEFIDIDGDNDLDLVVATQGEFSETFNDNDRLVLFRNIGNSVRPVYQLADTNFLNINAGSNKIRRMKHSFGDLNGDGKQDMVIGDMNGNIHYYTNTSSDSNISFNKVTGSLNGIYCGTFATPQLFDLNKDGLLDLIIGRKNGTIAYYQNNGIKQNPQFTAQPTIDSLGKFTVGQKVVSGGTTFIFDGYSVPYVCDIDKDGNYEMLVGSDQGKVFLYTNVEPNANATFRELTELFNFSEFETTISTNHGNRCAVAMANLTTDTVPDLIVGNKNGGLHFYKTKLINKISNINNTFNTKLNVNLYPNPTNGSLVIETDEILTKTSYKIFDINGRILLEGLLHNQNNINVSTLANGVYFIHLVNISTNKSTVEKVIVSK